jgi:UrcA family protein
MTMNTLTVSKGLRGTFAAAALIVAGAAGSAPCFAGGTDDVSATLTYLNTDASNPGSAVQFYKRLHSTAMKVCFRPGETGLEYRKDINACIHNAVAGAVSAINAPALTAIYNAKNAAPRPIVLADAGSR